MVDFTPRKNQRIVAYAADRFITNVPENNSGTRIAAIADILRLSCKENQRLHEIIWGVRTWS
jgi:N-acetyl-beta-hexosaminidase